MPAADPAQQSWFWWSDPGWQQHGDRRVVLKDRLDAVEERARRQDALLRRAYDRLMVSEGDARYIDNNVALALEIEALLPEVT
jgi:hypothetical protein